MKSALLIVLLVTVCSELSAAGFMGQVSKAGLVSSSGVGQGLPWTSAYRTTCKTCSLGGSKWADGSALLTGLGYSSYGRGLKTSGFGGAGIFHALSKPGGLGGSFSHDLGYGASPYGFTGSIRASPSSGVGHLGTQVPYRTPSISHTGLSSSALTGFSPSLPSGHTPLALPVAGHAVPSGHSGTKHPLPGTQVTLTTARGTGHALHTNLADTAHAMPSALSSTGHAPSAISGMGHGTPSIVQASHISSAYSNMGHAPSALLGIRLPSSAPTLSYTPYGTSASTSAGRGTPSIFPVGSGSSAPSLMQHPTSAHLGFPFGSNTLQSSALSLDGRFTYGVATPGVQYARGYSRL